MSLQYSELGPLAAEIFSLVWDTSANFKGFRVLAALLHGTLVGVSQTCGVLQRAPLIFGRAAITLGIGRHSSLITNGRSFTFILAFKYLVNYSYSYMNCGSQALIERECR